MSSPHTRATQLAETVADAWYRAHGSGSIVVAVSTVAALSFLTPPDAETRRQAAADLERLTPEEFTQAIAHQWALFINARPDLVNPVWPLVEPWLGEHSMNESALQGAKRVADAVTKAGLFDLTGTQVRRDTDLLGPVLTELRSKHDVSARGQYYTPPDVATMMALLVGTPQEGETVMEPTAGTGGTLRAQAEAMRQHGRDPATVTWVANDIDPVAIACLAANTVLWELGPRVLLGVGDSLRGDWMEQALAQRQETIDLARTTRAVKTMLALTASGAAHAEEAAPAEAEEPEPVQAPQKRKGEKGPGPAPAGQGGGVPPCSATRCPLNR